MAHLDRLSTLVSQMNVRGRRLVTVEDSNLALIKEDGVAQRLDLYLSKPMAEASPIDARLKVELDLGGAQNPLFMALPPCLSVDLAKAPHIASIAALIESESAGPRCGGGIALDRLCGLLVINLLRLQIEKNDAKTGVFAGLAHPKLNRVLVAMHDQPERHWQVDDFLPIAGMSRSQFMAEFLAVVGRSPMAYLKSWRMTVAQGALLEGARVNETARRIGYASGDAFTRAFVASFGVSPKAFVAQQGQNPA